MKPLSTSRRRIALGPILLSLLMFVTACAEDRVIVRTKVEVVSWPKTLSSDCDLPSESSRQKTGQLPQEIKALETALEDCNSQLRIGREFEEEVKREVEKLNKERGSR